MKIFPLLPAVLISLDESSSNVSMNQVKQGKCGHQALYLSHDSIPNRRTSKKKKKKKNFSNALQVS